MLDFKKMSMITSFCEVHFAEGLGYSLMANTEHLSQRRGPDNKKENFNQVYLAGVKMIIPNSL